MGLSLAVTPERQGRLSQRVACTRRPPRLRGLCRPGGSARLGAGGSAALQSGDHRPTLAAGPAPGQPGDPSETQFAGGAASASLDGTPGPHPVRLTRRGFPAHYALIGRDVALRPTRLRTVVTATKAPEGDPAGRMTSKDSLGL